MHPKPKSETTGPFFPSFFIDDYLLLNAIIDKIRTAKFIAIVPTEGISLKIRAQYPRRKTEVIIQI
jgi:hypothetical protein